MSSNTEFDAIIVGGGHNGLAAAAYLARAGRDVLVLEKLEHPGGAAVSAHAFDGVDARLSRYSYLVSLLPQQIIDDLGLRIKLARRRYSSYTPDPQDGSRALLVDNEDEAATAASFTAVGAPDGEFRAFTAFYAACRQLTEALWPTMTSPLLPRSEARSLANRAGASQAWEAMIEHPIGNAISKELHSDLVRGVVLTDALIGTFARADDEDLQQNICFLYHLIGGGTGDWDVPVGGMGAVSGELERAARDAGATILTSADVTAVRPGGAVDYRHGGQDRTSTARWILANVAPAVLERLRGTPESVLGCGRAVAVGGADAGADRDGNPNHRREGAQVKVNLLLKRLPRLLDGSVSPEAAFGGTFHINETWSQLDAAYRSAAAGAVPSPLPCEIYCHSLTDPSILSPELRAAGAQTLTVFGLHVPDRLVTAENNEARRAELQSAVLASLNSVLAEPIEDLLLTDADGRPCIETKTTLDIERAVGMPRGNIFHGGLDWPFVEDGDPLDTPARRWGVATDDPRILLCGSGARRGGAVSAIGGHNAAMAVLESERAWPCVNRTVDHAHESFLPRPRPGRGQLEPAAGPPGGGDVLHGISRRDRPDHGHSQYRRRFLGAGRRREHHHDGLPDDGGDGHPAQQLAGGAARCAPGVLPRHRHLHRGVTAVRAQPGPHHADPEPCPAGRRRGHDGARGHPGGAARNAEEGPAAGHRLPGVARAAGTGPGAARGRRADDLPVLALDLPGQPAPGSGRLPGRPAPGPGGRRR